MPTPPKPRRPARPRPKTRAELLAREKADWDELAATWRGLSDEALLRHGASGPDWTIKDVINHIAAWQEAALRVIPELLAGRKATAGHSTDRFNALHHAADLQRGPAASKRRLSRTRRQLLALIDTIPEDTLLDPSTRVNWWIKYSMYSHYGEHIFNLQNIVDSG